MSQLYWYAGIIAFLIKLTGLILLSSSIHHMLGELQKDMIYLFIASFASIFYGAFIVFAGLFELPLSHWSWTATPLLFVIAASMFAVSSTRLATLLDDLTSKHDNRTRT